MSKFADEILTEMSKGILNWYDFKEGSTILEVTNDNVTDVWEKQHFYDYIILNGVLETCKNPKGLLSLCKCILNSNGTLLLATDNRLGIRYFCGDRDPFTGRSFDGIENYRRSLSSDGAREGRCYSQAEIENFLNETGFNSRRFYAVLPDIKHPQLIFAEDYIPTEELAMRYFPLYNNPDTVFLEEEFLYTDLIQNGLFYKLANSYLVECTLPENMANINQVTLSMDRDNEDVFLTIIRRDKRVEKRAVYKEGQKRLGQLIENAKDLEMHNINVVEADFTNGKYVMPFIDAPLASVYLKNLAHTDQEKFISEMDRFRDLILKSSDVVEVSDEEGIILKRGYFDLVPINSFFVNNVFLFYDQEFYVQNYPANVMITRLVDLIYQGDFELEQHLPKDFFLERYGLKLQIAKWRKLIREFLMELRNEKELRVFHEKHRRNMEMVHTNRQRINYSESEYQRLFVDIFNGLENKKLILFGSGNFSRKFMALYGKEYPIYAVLDNKPSKWGNVFEGVNIVSPKMLEKLDVDEYKVIICIKNYLAVMKQLQNMGVKHLGIYDTNKEYQRKTNVRVFQKSIEDTPKKYHVGYIAGVFDLFHIGHLNMFKRAKEQCDYLIVGVVTDEGVRKNKKVEPFIPFEERIEMVRSCKYVDEAVEIPLNYAGTRDAYRLHHFDAQFSGSDYINNPDWLAEKEFLKKHGAELVFFPYTEQTSSTKIKALINKKLEEQ